MKKAEYYINVISEKGLPKEYPKVNGWIEEVTDSRGNTLTIGYDKRGVGCWIATELNTGFKCNIETCKTKAECIENVHNIIDTIVNAYNRFVNDTEYYKKYIQPFRDFVNKVN